MTWDFKFSQGDLVINELKQIDIVDGVDKIKQDIEHILKCVKGSDAFNPEFGVDWLKIKQSKFNRKLIEHEIRKALAGYDKIRSIDRIEISEPDSSRKIKILLYLIADGGQVQTEVVV